ncbi:MAG: hypothetical protein HY584_04860 [Candidatus Omnitrophica bacterium]|nr:hypothetical protein [Candidatus Omnitrophota bacterium]
MRKIHIVIARFAMTLFLLVAPRLSSAEEVPFRIDGRVVRADEAKRILVVAYEHPATGEHIEKEFAVSESAGFKDFKKLSELQKGDLVSFDYLDYKGLPKAIYVMRIPLEKTYFTHKEIAGAVLKARSNHKVAHVSES